MTRHYPDLTGVGAWKIGFRRHFAVRPVAASVVFSSYCFLYSLYLICNFVTDVKENYPKTKCTVLNKFLKVTAEQMENVL